LLVFLSYIPERLRWVVTGAVTAALILVWGFFFYVPLFLKTNACKKNIETQKAIYHSLTKKIGTQLFFGESCLFEQVPAELATQVRKSRAVCTHVMQTEAGDYDVGLKSSFRNFLRFLERFLQKFSCVEIKKMFCCRSGRRKIEVRLLIGDSNHA